MGFTDDYIKNNNDQTAEDSYPGASRTIDDDCNDGSQQHQEMDKFMYFAKIVCTINVGTSIENNIPNEFCVKK